MSKKQGISVQLLPEENRIIMVGKFTVTINDPDGFDAIIAEMDKQINQVRSTMLEKVARHEGVELQWDN